MPFYDANDKDGVTAGLVRRVFLDGVEDAPWVASREWAEKMRAVGFEADGPGHCFHHAAWACFPTVRLNGDVRVEFEGEQAVAG